MWTWIKNAVAARVVFSLGTSLTLALTLAVLFGLAFAIDRLSGIFSTERSIWLALLVMLAALILIQRRNRR